MKIKFLLVLIFFISNNLFAILPLHCSANGLNVIYINGVNVNQDGNTTSAANVTKAILSIKGELDKNKLNDTLGVWNTSRPLLNDIEELKAQLASNHFGKKRIEFWRAKAKDEMYQRSLIEGHTRSDAQVAAEKARIDAALVQITSKPKFTFLTDPDGKFILDGNGEKIIDQDSYSQSDLYKDLVKYNTALANLLANASSDIAVVEQLKIKIKEAYKGGLNKVIVVAHSQGNEVLFSAIKDIRRVMSDAEKNKFDGLVGYMQVAPPSPELVTSPVAINDANNHAQYIRHNRDGVIGMSQAMTSEVTPGGVIPVAANYTAEVGIPPGGVPILSDISHFLDNFFNTYGNKGVTAFYHGMDEVYLSDTYKATRNTTGVNQALVDHFKDNMREIASKLEDNCDSKVIFCNAGLLPNKMNFALEGNVDFSLNHIFPASGINSDPHTCECHEVNLKEGGNAINVSGSGSFGTANYELVPFKGTIYGTGGLQYFSTSVDFVNGQLKVGVVEGIYATNYCGPFVYKN